MNRGGEASRVRLETVLKAEIESLFGPEAAAALQLWEARPGAVVTVVDSQNQYWRARLTALDTTGGALVPFQHMLQPPESPLQLTVYQALPEKERFELILEKLTELGVVRIVPLLSERSVTVEARDSGQKKSHRWPEVLRRAAVQCRRAILPELGEPVTLEAAASASCGDDLRLILDPYETGWTLAAALERQRPVSVSLFVGPEGGFSPAELDFARSSGILPVAFGARVLRTESAAIAAAAAVQFALGDLGRRG